MAEEETEEEEVRGLVNRDFLQALAVSVAAGLIVSLIMRLFEKRDEKRAVEAKSG